MAFRIDDIYLPDGPEAARDLDDDVMLVGRLRGYSDSGADTGAFGVVELSAGRIVIVPADRLRRIAWPLG